MSTLLAFDQAAALESELGGSASAQPRGVFGDIGLTGKLLVHCGTAWGEAVYQEFDGCGDEVMGA